MKNFNKPDPSHPHKQPHQNPHHQPHQAPQQKPHAPKHPHPDKKGHGGCGSCGS